jgi:osmotically-inducible protein OsmY
VLVEPEAAIRDVQALYRVGVTAVLYWPREAKILSPILAEVLGIALIRGPARRVDTALERNVRAHLRLFGGTTPGLRVAVRDGVAHLGGSVPSLPRKQEVDEMVASVAGIRATDTSGLYVLPRRKVTDRELRRSVRVLLRAVAEHEDTTVVGTVRSGHVRLTGTVRNQKELARLEHLVSQVPGVRGVESLVRFQRRRASQAATVQRRLAARLGAAFPDADLQVSFFSGVVVLHGRVSRLATKRGAARIVAEDDAVERVLNKVEVG